MTLSRHLTPEQKHACASVREVSKSMAALARKGDLLQALDARWLSALPADWLTTREAAEAWGVSPHYAWERLDLLKASGLVWRGGNGQVRRWRKA